MVGGKLNPIGIVLSSSGRHRHLQWFGGSDLAASDLCAGSLHFQVQPPSRCGLYSVNKDGRPPQCKHAALRDQSTRYGTTNFHSASFLRRGKKLLINLDWRRRKSALRTGDQPPMGNLRNGGASLVVAVAVAVLVVVPFGWPAPGPSKPSSCQSIGGPPPSELLCNLAREGQLNDRAN